jgi:ubiquinone biosynthesis protein Coq4
MTLDRDAPRSGLLGHLRRVLADPFDTSALPAFLAILGRSPVYRVPYARMLASLSPAEVAALKAATLEPIPFEWLGALDTASFGQSYRRFVLDAGLSWDFYQRLPLGHDWRYLRFAKLHDFHHTLLGLDQSVRSEVFLQALDWFNFGEPAGLATLVGLPLLARRHGEARALLASAIAGARLGRALPSLYVFRFEDHYATPLVELRRRLGLPEAGVSL